MLKATDSSIPCGMFERSDGALHILRVRGVRWAIGHTCGNSMTSHSIRCSEEPVCVLYDHVWCCWTVLWMLATVPAAGRGPGLTLTTLA